MKEQQSRIGSAVLYDKKNKACNLFRFVICYRRYHMRYKSMFGIDIYKMIIWVEERKSIMQKRITFAWLSDKILVFLIMISMLLTKEIRVADFPVYSLLLFAGVFGWMAAGIFLYKKRNRPFLRIRYWTDLLALAAVLYEIFLMVKELFWRNPAVIDFSGNAEAIALAILYFLMTNEIRLKRLYFDLILYGGLLFASAYIFPHLTVASAPGFLQPVFADQGAVSACLLLVCMVGTCEYCFCRERLRSCFCLAVTLISFFALFLNRNVLSFWLMAAYFIAIPIVLRPTAQLIKRDMQMFFLYGLLLSNMSLLAEYTGMILTELPYSLEHSVYLDLIFAAGGIFFFHFWEKIPEGIDPERIIMRRMQHEYQILFMDMGIFFTGIVIGADRWMAIGEELPGAALRGFVIPLAEAVRNGESAFYVCFRDGGLPEGLAVILFIVLMTGKMRLNYGLDKPRTGMLILISVFFMTQLLFWKPAVGTTVIYMILLLFAAFYEEEEKRTISMKIQKENLKGV